MLLSGPDEVNATFADVAPPVDPGLWSPRTTPEDTDRDDWTDDPAADDDTGDWADDGGWEDGGRVWAADLSEELVSLPGELEADDPTQGGGTGSSSSSSSSSARA